MFQTATALINKADI